MEPTSTEVPEARDPSAVAEPVPPVPVAHVEDELLVEEISIDGMCGVY